MSDDIRLLTELLARDPANIAFRQLAEILRRRGDLDAAYRVAVRGLERHSLDAESHALLARICVDRGELQRAFDEWDMALRLSPGHTGALKGLGFISYRWGRLQDAERYLVAAMQSAGGDASVASALESVRRAAASLSGLPDTSDTSAGEGGFARARTATPTAGLPVAAGAESASGASGGGAPILTEVQQPPAGGAQSFLDLDEGSDPLAAAVSGSALQPLIIDRDGLLVAGMFVMADGSDHGAELAAELSAVSEECDRAMRHLRMGSWSSITFESPTGVFAMTPAGDGSLAAAVAHSSVPLGLLRRVVTRVRAAAATIVGGDR